MTRTWRVEVIRKLREVYFLSASGRDEAEERALERAQEPDREEELDAFVVFVEEDQGDPERAEDPPEEDRAAGDSPMSTTTRWDPEATFKNARIQLLSAIDDLQSAVKLLEDPQPGIGAWTAMFGSFVRSAKDKIADAQRAR